MQDINRVLIRGVVGQDPNSYEKVVKFSVATNQQKKDGDKITTWHNIVVFNQLNTARSIRKGDRVLVLGALTTEKYEGKTKTSIVSETLCILRKEKQEEKDEDLLGGFDDSEVPF